MKAPGITLAQETDPFQYTFKVFASLFKDQTVITNFGKCQLNASKPEGILCILKDVQENISLSKCFVKYVPNFTVHDKSQGLVRLLHLIILKWIQHRASHSLFPYPPTLCKALAIVLLVALQHFVLDELNYFGQGECLLARAARQYIIGTVRRFGGCFRVCYNGRRETERERERQSATLLSTVQV